MHDRQDTSFEVLLAETLAERAERIPATVTTERVRARLEERRTSRHQGRMRRPQLLLGVAAIFLLPLAALVAGQWPPSPDVTDQGGYQAIVHRTTGDEWRIVAVRGDGRERVLSSIPVPDPGSDRRRPPLTLAPDGRLATPGASGWEFRDLREPGQVVGPFAPFLDAERGRAWLGDGRFAAWNEAGEVMLLDPEAGTVERVVLPGPLVEVIAATADGSALISRGDWGRSITYWGARRPAEWRVLRLDGATAPAPAGEPGLGDLELGWRSGTWWRGDGSRVQLCDLATRSECPGLPNGAVVVESPDGTLAPWYTDELAPDDVVDVAMGASGIWLLFDGGRGPGVQSLAHAGVPGEMTTVATWGPFDAPDAIIEGVAPDDSLVVAGSLLIDPRTGGVVPMQGDLMGFLRPRVVDTLGGGPLQAAAPLPSPGPDLSAYPSLRPLEAVIAEQLTSADRLLWQEDHPAVAGPAASPTTTVIGPIEVDVGLGAFLACSGPSDVIVTLAGPDGQLTIEGPDGQELDPTSSTPILSRCLDSSELAGGSMACCRFSGPITFTVTASRDTAWQLLIFDPAPGE